MPTSSVTSLSLLARIRQDDSSAWKELVSLYTPLVDFWCRRHAVPESDIQDLRQEVFFAVSRSINRFQPSGNSGSFRAWLWSITRHKMVDWLRCQSRSAQAVGGSSALQLVQNLPEEIDEQDHSERCQFNELIHRAMEQTRAEFEPKSWQAFWRTTVDGLSVAQVAEDLSISMATVRQHRSRILRRLRQQLGEQL